MNGSQNDIQKQNEQKNQAKIICEIFGPNALASLLVEFFLSGANCAHFKNDSLLPKATGLTETGRYFACQEQQTQKLK